MRRLAVRLTSWEARRLRHLRARAPSARVVRRAICLLLSAAGRPVAEICRATGLSPRAVTDVRRRWDRGGRLRSLADRPRAGRPPVVTPAYRRELRRALRRGPRAWGYVFTVWSVARLGAHLRGRTGVSVSRDWLRRLARAEGFVVGRPAHTLANKRDPAAYRAARRRLDRLKKGRPRRPRPTSCGTPTRPRSTCCPTSPAGGGRPGGR